MLRLTSSRGLSDLEVPTRGLPDSGEIVVLLFCFGIGMIYLHKLLPLFFSPLVVVFALVGYGAIKGRKRLSLIGLGVLLFASVPAASDRLFQLVEGCQGRQDPKSVPVSDAVVVLSGMLVSVPSGQGVVTEWHDPDRFFAGVDLFQSGKANKIVFTGGRLPWQTQSPLEGVALKGYAESMGVPSNAILVTGEVENTEQEAKAVRSMLSKEASKIVLVTSAFHMERAAMLFEKEGLEVYRYPVDFKVEVSETTVMDFMPNPRALWMTDLAVRELIGRLFYRARNSLIMRR